MEMMNQLKTNKLFQGILLGLYVAITGLALFLADKSVTAFLLLLLSLLLLYYTSFTNKVKWGIGIFILAVVLPSVAHGSPAYESYMDVATLVGIYVAMALGLNIVVGMAGLLDLGFVAFFAVGAYTYAIFATPQASNFLPGNYPLSGESFWIFLLIGGLLAAIFGILLGIPVLRVKGDYLAIVTLGFGEIIRIVFNNLDTPINITNGSMGISSIKAPSLFGYEFIESSQYYFIVLVILAIIIFFVRRLEFSKIGRAWKAVRENEIAAQAMGVPLVKTKLTAFAVGASFSGMMGVVFAAKQMFIDPTSFTLLESITILVMVILGGMGSLPGVILGAAFMTILNLQVLTEVTNYFNQLSLDGVISIPDALSPAKLQRFIFGGILILFAVYRPQGLIPAKSHKFSLEQVKGEGSSSIEDRKVIEQKSEGTSIVEEGM